MCVDGAVPDGEADHEVRERQGNGQGQEEEQDLRGVRAEHPSDPIGTPGTPPLGHAPDTPVASRTHAQKR